MTATLLLAVVVAAGQPQSRFVNAQVDTRAATQPLAREIAAATARGGARWIGYRVKVNGGHRSMDCAARTTVALEPAAEIDILARFDGATLTRLRTSTPDCEIDAGGLPVTWLENVKADDSATWLASIVNSAASVARGDRVVNTAVAALGMHEGAAASRSLVSIARSHGVAKVRSDALFWLSQRAGDQLAERTIVEAVERDPDTDVRTRAVFALSQLPRDEGIPRLIDVAKNNRNAAVRKQAMFWLGQSNDPRALKFFEDVLLK